jgi:hypothetical protein
MHHKPDIRRAPVRNHRLYIRDYRAPTAVARLPLRRGDYQTAPPHNLESVVCSAFEGFVGQQLTFDRFQLILIRALLRVGLSLFGPHAIHLHFAALHFAGL